MSLPSPNLDNRKFQELVDDAKRYIWRRCPEWTDHNVSDPGVTLIEMFASMTEQILYRINQVPEKNYVKFLEMIGVALEPPAAARVDLRFQLTAPIENVEGAVLTERLLPSRETVASTLRTETEEAIEFATDRDLRLTAPILLPLLLVSGKNDGTPGDLTPENVRAINTLALRPLEQSGARVPDDQWRTIYSDRPREGDCLYIGFERDVSGNTIEMQFECLRAAATGLSEAYPAQQWEVWNGAEGRWDPAEVNDRTLGFNRSIGTYLHDDRPVNTRENPPVGYLELMLPSDLRSRRVGSIDGYWVRVRYTTNLPPLGEDKIRPSAYTASPRIRGMRAMTTGGTMAASNAAAVLYRELGESDGTPGQVFSLGASRILALRPGETVIVGVPDIPFKDWEPWQLVKDFAESGPEDRHFVLDYHAGEVFFGPAIPQPDGSMRQHGAVPPKGLTVAFNAFRHGGGTRGNVAAGQIRILKSSIPYVADVTNPRRALGGQEPETLERAKLRGRAILRMTERAVTAADFEDLAMRASSAVGRARCVQPLPVHNAGESGERIPSGVVKVLLVPALSESNAVPKLADFTVTPEMKRQVEDYLDARRLLTTVLELGEPEYLFISTDIYLVADPKADADVVGVEVRRRLERFIHPLFGGPDGTGWPFRRSLQLADIYAKVGGVPGVAFLRRARMYQSRVTGRNTLEGKQGTLTDETRITGARGLQIQDNQLICSREHRIHVQSIWELDGEDDLEEQDQADRR